MRLRTLTGQLYKKSAVRALERGILELKEAALDGNDVADSVSQSALTTGVHQSSGLAVSVSFFPVR